MEAGTELLFMDERETLMDGVNNNDFELENIYEAFEAISKAEPPMLPESQIPNGGATKAAEFLVDIEELFKSMSTEDYEYWYIMCSGHLASICKQRSISLKRYFDMIDIIQEFQDEAIKWYVRRNRRQAQPRKLTDIKKEYVERIQTEFFPDKPLNREGNRTWSRHIAARYIRTAQDEIIRSHELTY